uniref:Uncharacterized protein n=1 Tax=Sphaerodactylus townsendi TaxID=933632 RepID=A0ACB8ESE7_9SAUR
MAKWLNKYFSLGNNKTKSPPQPPRPDYRDKRNGTAVAGGGGGGHHNHNHHHHNHNHTSPCFPRHDTSDLLRAYRAQKERDFEDPYSGPGSSLRKLRALCRAEYCAPEELLAEPAGPKPFSSASCCGGAGAGTGNATVASSSASPQLFRSHSERRAATPPDNGAVKYISPKHRLIKIESGSNEAGKAGGAPITWSPPGGGGGGGAASAQKKLNKFAEQAEGGGGGSGAKKEKTQGNIQSGIFFGRYHIPEHGN